FARRRQRPHDRDAVYVFGLDAGERETGAHGFLRQSARMAASREFGFLDSRGQFAVLQQGAGGVAQNTADSEDVHRGVVAPFCAFSILAQVSRNTTVRLKTRCSGVESLSTQK